MPEHSKAPGASRETFEHAPIGVGFENVGDNVGDQCAKAPTPGSGGNAIPGGYGWPAVNSFSA